MCIIIYKATNIQNGKVYIGQTVNSLDHRKNQHLHETKQPNRKNTYFHNAIEKYGEDSFVFEEIDRANSIDELNEKESFWIAFYNSTDKASGYNLDSGGKNCKKSARTKELMSECTKALWNDPDRAERMLAGLKAGVEAMKSRKGADYVTKACPTCGKEFSVPRYEAKRRKYCSWECSKGKDYQKGVEHATKVIMERKQKQRSEIKNDVIDWAINHKDVVLSCPLNRIITVYSELIEMIYTKYGIKDFRCIIYAVVESYSRKEFAKFLKSVCSEENICRTGLN